MLSVGEKFNPDPREPIMTSIFKQYERVLIESTIEERAKYLNWLERIEQLYAEGFELVFGK